MSTEEFCDNLSFQLQTFDLIISSNRSDKINSLLMSYAEKFCEKLVITRNFGLIHYLRIYENFHANMQLKLSDNPIQDVRIAGAWKELKEFCLSFNLNQLDEMKHKHIPYVVILIQALEQFREKYNRHPCSADKTEFRDIIKSMNKFEDEENFKEALNYYYYANKDKLNVITPELNSIFEIIENEGLETLLKRSNLIMSIFFIICRGFQIFYKNYETLPVVGNIPDMTSDTETYINLKRIYERKWLKDKENILKIIFEVVESIHDNELSLKKDQIIATLNNGDIPYVDIICKNWPQISLFQFNTIKEEDTGFNYSSNEFDESHHITNFIWYLIIKSVDLFYEENGRFPGEIKKFEDDVKPLYQCLEKFLNSNDKINKIPFGTDLIKEEYLYEFCRMSNSKIVPVISIISSITSQEIIKLITYQFKTINNTLIFDGINNTISTFKL